jgi:hypothetical protein
MEKYLYKAQGVRTVDANGGFTTSKIHYYKFKVVSETPKGYWIELLSKKWVPKEGKNVYARLTKKEALNDLICKKQRQIKILKTNLNIAQSYLTQALKVNETL